MDLNQSLYIEHLEELSMLYEQRVGLICINQWKWPDFMPLEQRFEPHIDALVIGEDEALALCEEMAVSGEYSECYGALRVICRQTNQKILATCVAAMDLGKTENAMAARDALCQDLPESFQDEFVQFLLKKSPDHILLAARIIASRRLDFASELIEALQRYADEKKMVLTLIHAIGRLRPRHGTEFLLNFLHSTDKEIVDTAVTALIRIGERRALRECMAFIGPGDWPKMSLGLYGDQNTLSDSFFSVSDFDEEDTTALSRDHVIAIGLLGNIASIHELIDCLENPDLAESAALALNLITGAQLTEEVFVPDDIDPDDLFDDERELWEKGLLYPKGKEPGVMINRLSRNSDDWIQWWKKKQRRFNHRIRYRNGKPYSPACLLDNMTSKDSPEMIRKLAHEELVIRYGIDIPFETHMTVHQQLRAIETYMIRLKGNPDGFVDGLWYYNGKPINEGLMVFENDVPSTFKEVAP
ncbi:MAG: hypothetical protein KKD44_05700 [Proteobacteria bacterium]|nr:hypothetical protein [Pseudomonadota bacterium]